MSERRPTPLARRRRLTAVVTVLAAIAGVAAYWTLRDAAERLATVEPVQTVRDGEVQVNLFVLGDWGDDTAAQREVAAAMAARAGGPGGRPDAVLLAGDNYYGSLTGVDDAAWEKLFERMYDPSALGIPFYAVLGNHDYQDGKDTVQLDYARRNPASRWKMPDRWYRLDLPAGTPLATVLMIDSNRKSLAVSDWTRQEAWLRAEFAKPRQAKWLIVCAHHPLFSNGKHGDEPSLQRTWGPLLQSAGVDFYLCGHDHGIQHLEIPGLDTAFLVSGGGGADSYAIKRTDRGPFAGQTHGFLHLRLGASSADAHFIDREGRVVHSFSREPLLSPASRRVSTKSQEMSAPPRPGF